MLKRDIFSKVVGSVRSVQLLEQQAQVAKVAIALGAAAAQRAIEWQELEEVVEQGSVGVQALLNATLVQQYATQLAEAEALLSSGALDAEGYAAEQAYLQEQLDHALAELSLAATSCPKLPFYHAGACQKCVPVGPSSVQPSTD